MSKQHTVTLYHIIMVYIDMIDPMDGIMQALGKQKTNGKETDTLP
jgi:hypothetical protein